MQSIFCITIWGANQLDGCNYKQKFYALILQL